MKQTSFQKLLYWKTFVRPGVSHPHSSAASYGSWVAIAATLVSAGVLSKGQRLRRSKDDPKSPWGAWTWVEPLRLVYYIHIICIYTLHLQYIIFFLLYLQYIFCILYIYICVCTPCTRNISFQLFSFTSSHSRAPGKGLWPTVPDRTGSQGFCHSCFLAARVHVESLGLEKFQQNVRKYVQ